jgi:hypothetical protein
MIPAIEREEMFTACWKDAMPVWFTAPQPPSHSKTYFPFCPWFTLPSPDSRKAAAHLAGDNGYFGAGAGAPS